MAGANHCTGGLKTANVPSAGNSRPPPSSARCRRAQHDVFSFPIVIAAGAWGGGGGKPRGGPGRNPFLARPWFRRFVLTHPTTASPFLCTATLISKPGWSSRKSVQERPPKTPPSPQTTRVKSRFNSITSVQRRRLGLLVGLGQQIRLHSSSRSLPAHKIIKAHCLLLPEEVVFSESL